MSGRRRLMMVTGKNKSLLLEMGLDTCLRVQLSGNYLVVNTLYSGSNYGGVGTHHDLRKNFPELYFGNHMCYANKKIWDLSEPLPLGFTPDGIAAVELLECGRDNVSVGSAESRCYIIWTDQYASIVDNEVSSSRYLFKIIFY